MISRVLFVSLFLGAGAAASVPEPVQIPSVPPDPDPAYTQVIQERARKITEALNLEDAVKARQVQEAIADQYRTLSLLYDTRDAQIKSLRERTDVQEEAKTLAIQSLKEMTEALVARQHVQYLLKLSALLSPEQIDRVKDGMTYGLVQVTYRSYLEMLPHLTEEQKATILAYLLEARERAMDAGSSGQKHQWFGKYKGRINNYLSIQGYDLKKASEERNARNQRTLD